MPTPSGMLRAVRGVDLAVGEGETLGIVGESGCGKSLTAMSILDLLPPNARRSARRIAFQGRDLLQLSEPQMRDLRGNEIGTIFQDPMTALNPAYTIGNQLCEGYLRHRSANRKEAEERAIHLLDRVGITAARNRLRQYPHQLSGGLRQRIVIAMALMCEPKLLIADEPTTALDVTIQAQILRLINDLQAELRASVIIITHDLGVVAQMANRVAVMYAGEVIENASIETIFSNPQHPYTSGLLACIPVRGHTSQDGRLGAIPGVVPSLVGDIRGCAFRSRCGFATGECNDDIPLHTGRGAHLWRCTRTPRMPPPAGEVQ